MKPLYILLIINVLAALGIVALLCGYWYLGVALAIVPFYGFVIVTLVHDIRTGRN